MKKITHINEAITWLHEKLLVAPTSTQVYYIIETVADIVANNIADGESMRGLALEFWQPVFEGLAASTRLDSEELMPVPRATFITELLSDLAMRGEAGSVSREQMALMMIGALDWNDQFRLVTKDGVSTIKSYKLFELEHAVRFRVPVPADVMLDLHYSIGG